MPNPTSEEEDAHVLMPAALAAEVPALYATENEKDALARIKYFTPDCSWTWFVVEYDPEQRLCFGVVVGHERELGYFSLDELESARGPLGLRVERDLHFEPAPVSQCR